MAAIKNSTLKKRLTRLENTVRTIKNRLGTTKRRTTKRRTTKRRTTKRRKRSAGKK